MDTVTAFLNQSAELEELGLIDPPKRPSSLPSSFAADVEAGAGAIPLEHVLSKLDEHEAEWCRLSALHGSFGKFDSLRKAKLCTVAMQLRETAPPAGATKWTDDLLDKAAHAHADYVEFLLTGEAEHARYIELNVTREKLQMAYNRGQVLIRYASRMAP